jgi:HD-like signal output (HDOD) protein
MSQNGTNGYRERALAALNDLPPFPPVLNQLIATMGEQTNSINEIAKIVQIDPVIAGQVLQVANSAMYARSASISSIPRAAALLGVNKLRNLAIAMSVTRTMRPKRMVPGWSDQRFNVESLICALICDALARRLPIPNPDAAFAAGLLHHLGTLLIAFALPDKYARIHDNGHSNGTSTLDREREAIGTTHAELAGSALRQWNLPAPICDAAEYHHDPEREKRDLKPGEIGLSLAIACADEYIATSRNRKGRMMEIEPQFQGEPPEPFKPLGMRLAAANFLETVDAELHVIGGVLFGRIAR